MNADPAPALLAATAALLGTLAGPLLAAIRLLALLSFGGLMAGASIRWRYRIAGSLLLGWAAAGSASLPDGSFPSLAASEIAFGALLGIAVGALLLSLKLAGELIDDRLRLTGAAGEDITGDPEPAGPAVRLLGALGLLLVILGGPAGEMPVLEGLLGSFQAAPPGRTADLWQNWRGPLSVLTLSLEIALRTALPVLAAATVIDWCQILIARTAPTAPAALAATAVRPFLGLAVLVATFGGAVETLLQTIRRCLTLSSALGL